jgi:hypothetical protein
MPWVTFTAAFDFKPKAAVTIAYRAGETRLVTTPCAQMAKAAGKAIASRKPKAGGHG